MSRQDPVALLQRITSDPAVMFGQPTIRGKRLTVEQILNSLACGVTEEELFADYPFLEKEDLQAVWLYAAQLVEQANQSTSRPQLPL